MGRPPKGTLPLLYPRWVLLEYIDGKFHMYRTFAQRPYNVRREIGAWCAVHSTEGIVSTYQTNDEYKVEPFIVESRFLLHNPGGNPAKHHWSIVHKVGPMRGYYLLVDTGANRVLSTVEVASFGNL